MNKMETPRLDPVLQDGKTQARDPGLQTHPIELVVLAKGGMDQDSVRGLSTPFNLLPFTF